MGSSKNTLKFPFFGFLSSPYFTHGVSCAMLNINWTPLTVLKVNNAVLQLDFVLSPNYKGSELSWISVVRSTLRK